MKKSRIFTVLFIVVAVLFASSPAVARPLYLLNPLTVQADSLDFIDGVTTTAQISSSSGFGSNLSVRVEPSINDSYFSVSVQSPEDRTAGFTFHATEMNGVPVVITGQSRTLNSQSVIDLNSYFGDVDTNIYSSLSTDPVFHVSGSDAVVSINGPVNSLYDLTVHNGLSVSDGFLSYGGPEVVVISSDTITVASSRLRVDTEGAAALDELWTINGGNEGDRLVLFSNASGRDILVKDGSGNIQIEGDFLLSHIYDRLELEKRGTQWVQVYRSNNQ